MFYKYHYSSFLDCSSYKWTVKRKNHRDHVQFFETNKPEKKTETAIINPILKMEKLDSNLEWYLAKPK